MSILRGLKERYEVHHGVRLQDAALISAAQLSHRYIADRFLPDKAIDLVDEAAAKLNIEASKRTRCVKTLRCIHVPVAGCGCRRTLESEPTLSWMLPEQRRRICGLSSQLHRRPEYGHNVFLFFFYVYALVLVAVVYALLFLRLMFR